MKERDKKKREFLKKAAYAAPAILSLPATSSVARAGSEKDPTTTPKVTKPPKPKR
jgi:hypothetical protein